MVLALSKVIIVFFASSISKLDVIDLHDVPISNTKAIDIINLNILAIFFNSLELLTIRSLPLSILGYN